MPEIDVQLQLHVHHGSESVQRRGGESVFMIQCLIHVKYVYLFFFSIYIHTL